MQLHSRIKSIMTEEGILDADAAKKLRRQNYLKRMRRMYHQEAKKDRLHLAQKVQDLELELSELRRRTRCADREDTSLPWRDVAAALREAQDISTAQCHRLKQRVQVYEAVLVEMRQWVQACAALQGPAFNDDTLVWQGLMANPHSRKLGKAWLLQHMYHNTDRVFCEHGFPSMLSGDEMPGYPTFSFGEMGYTSVYRGQVDVDIPFEDAVEAMCSTVLTYRCYIPQYDATLPKLLDYADGHTHHYVFVTPIQEYVNLVVGAFRSANRTVLCIQQIQDDELFMRPRGALHRNRRIWCEARRLPNGRTKFRVISFHSQSMRDNEATKLDEDAKWYGLNLDDCPDELKETRFAWLITRQIESVQPKRSIKV
ncbi:Aste57867_8635 [Aphanomyces stellatus]|uniref:Aste57867_8635 protein n=1 Tax=Aphanomyces stellatus TaxID=120398 RepID=A0A485KKX4_9STRA|nr:hypothetical protein As57867_008601 [Aphanomyces stellatus]VFT85521.1 Aste57867_8635 [Aphanomyces stellatus]